MSMHTKRGFAAMPKERLEDVSRKGGQSSQASKKGFRWSKLEARAQSKRGGQARWKGHLKV